MSCETESKTIGEHNYSVTQWSAEKSILMKFRLVKVLGPSLTKLAKSVDTKNKKSTVDFNDISSALSQLFKDSSPEEITSLIKDCIIGVACDGTRITNSTFNELFSGDNLLEMYKVFIFTIKVNYANFIPGQLVEGFLAKMENLSTQENSQT